MDNGSHQAVLSLMRSIPAMSAKTKVESTARNVHDFLHTDIPFPVIFEPEILPIFPRCRQPGRGPEQLGCGGGPLIETLEAATKLSQSWLHEVDVKEEEEDMDHEHLVVVGGWREQVTIYSRNNHTDSVSRCVQDSVFPLDLGHAFSRRQFERCGRAFPSVVAGDRSSTGIPSYRYVPLAQIAGKVRSQDILRGVPVAEIREIRCAALEANATGRGGEVSMVP